MSHPKQGGLALTDTKADRRTASECIRTHKPKGVAIASPRAREAYRLHHDDGISVPQLAEAFGVTTATVRSWLRDARDAIEDERNLRRIGGHRV